MIGTRHPAGILTHHSCTAYKNILYRIIQTMSHMQHTGYIRRRNYYSKGFPFIRCTVEIFFIIPMLIPFLFGSIMFKIFCQLHKAANLPAFSQMEKLLNIKLFPGVELVSRHTFPLYLPVTKRK